jgi:hypothetical protein
MSNKQIKWRRAQSGRWHAVKEGDSKSMCGHVTFDVSSAQAPDSCDPSCVWCTRRVGLHPSATPLQVRRAQASLRAANIRVRIRESVPKHVLTNADALGMIAPIENRLAALILAWEMTGDPGLQSDITVTERELVARYNEA